MFDLTARLNYKNVPTWHGDICRHSYLADQAGGDNHLDEQKHDLYNESQSLSDILHKESIYVTIQATIDEAQDGENMQNHISLAKMLEVNQEVSTVNGTPSRIQYFGELEDHCYWRNEVKLYEHHVDALFAMLWHKKPDINYYVCIINKTFAKPGQCMYFQVHYMEENLLEYIDPHDDALIIRLADGHLLAECRIMLGIDKRATITTNWSEFCRGANIRERDICAFHFKVTAKSHLALTVYCL